MPALAGAAALRTLGITCPRGHAPPADLAAALRWAGRLPALREVVLAADDTLLRETCAEAVHALRSSSAAVRLVPHMLYGDDLRPLCVGPDPMPSCASPWLAAFDAAHVVPHVCVPAQTTANCSASPGTACTGVWIEGRLQGDGVQSYVHARGRQRGRHGPRSGTESWKETARCATRAASVVTMAWVRGQNTAGAAHLR